MTMEWKNRDYRFDSNGGNGRGSFEEHNQRMREFRKSHAPKLEANAPKQDKFILPRNIRDLHISRTMNGTGGTRDPNAATTRLALMFMWKLTPHKFSQN